MEPRSFYATLFCHRFQRLCWLWASQLMLVSWAQAATFETPESIQQQVNQYLRQYYQKLSPQRLDIQVNNLDRRLQLPGCSQPLLFRHADASQTGGNVSVHTRCEGEQPWALYVPAQVGLYRSVPLARRQLERGEIVTPADIDVRIVNISQLRQGIITDTETLVGMEIKRPLAAGDAFRSTAIDAPLMVRRGDIVNIEVQSGGISVSSSGTAMANGRQGDRIRVRNSQSDRIVTAEVIATGRVRTAI